ncbi:DUF4062 domain-containing protein [Pseudomonas syringae]|uniref:DUF4062 domain-containing protein n=1 Tax=Pseudomonas syringae TaxID=317 RepID=A0AB38C1Y1_PSESX|nr:DUF4062 domain-containing protein [Pseudomonas syringae]MCK0551301.1 DUF4062 domain-containing protein [Pseudomonas syringae pv. aptata]SFO58650.1 protein of unknown function [Pseudomonas syringae]SFP04569.1 protein of unknown function [Pseudomonas syringae]
MSSKYQIFVSSTYLDLKEPRDFVIKAILEMGHIPVGMEMFSAADEEQWSIIRRQIDQSDYYVLILANRYGSVTSEQISYTEKEYDYARSISIPCLGFILETSASWPSDYTDTASAQVQALSLFRDKVKQRPVSFWKNTDDLYGKCSIALMKAFTAYPREGWVRASQYIDGKSSTELLRLSSENARLREALQDSEAALEQKNNRSESDAVAVLKANERDLYVWMKDADDWKKKGRISLFDVFEVLAPEMFVEISFNSMSLVVATLLASKDYKKVRESHPIPANELKEWVADFAALDLIAPSVKKKRASDTEEYWTLTDNGKECLKFIRRTSLFGALNLPIQAPHAH